MNKENMLEELNKMKNLMVAKAGTVVSEQTATKGFDSLRKNKNAVSLKSRFDNVVSSLGVKDTRMTPETLQSILKSLESGTTATK